MANSFSALDPNTVPTGREDDNLIALGSTLRTVLTPLASLKFTVVLFAMAIFIVLAGTFAQVHDDIWVVIDKYFRVSPSEFTLTESPWDNVKLWFVKIDVQIFFPSSFFTSKPRVPGWIIFPKGWLIGVLMGINLVAAHLLRFKVQARGARLFAGLGIIGMGLLATFLVVASGSNHQGFQESLWSKNWDSLWMGIEFGLGALVIAAVIGCFTLGPDRNSQRMLLAGAAAVLGGALIYMLTQGSEGRFNDSSMRILWQLIKAEFAAVILLVGCWIAFKKRAGVVLLHGGIGLMMASEVLVGTQAVETQMSISEGETANYVHDIRSVELAVVDHSPDDHDNVTVVPGGLLQKQAALQKQNDAHADRVINSPELPFNFEVVKYLRNSVMRRAEPGEKNLATAGVGDRWIVEPVRAAAGTDVGGGVDIASAYLRLTTKEGQKLGTYLVSQHLREQPLEVEGKTYDLALRFKRTYKPYQVTLLDVRKDDYLGTSMVKNYSSDIRLVDETNDVDRKLRIWMNNPLRYAGETFYQSKYDRDPQSGTEMTALAVVSNTGWMIPYVSCMIVATGMLAHFLLGLVRFLNRRTRGASPPPIPSKVDGRGRKVKGSRKGHKNQGQEHFAPVELAPRSTAQTLERFVPLFVVLVFAAYLGSKARPPQAPVGETNVYAFGKLPVVYEGRVKPFDTLARNFLRVISNKQTYIDADGERQPAVRWLLDTVSGVDGSRDEQVFRIDNYRVLELFDLKPRSSNLYSVSEIAGGIGEFEKQLKSAREKPADELSAFQRKLFELEKRLQAYIMLTQAFHPPALPPLPTPEETREQGAEFRSKLAAVAMAAMREAKVLESRHPPLAVPIEVEEGKSNEVKWEPYASAWARALLATRIGYSADPATVSMSKILLAYRTGDVKTFNNEVESYRTQLQKDPPTDYDVKKTRFETFFNQFEPFYYCSVLYVVAFVLAALSWLGWSRPLNRSAFWLIAFTLVAHTSALAARIYISGRPPVTNLYSSAIFIGWAAVVVGLIFESIFRLGFGNIIAAVGGFCGLVIAHLLTTTVPSFRGDTFTVMQAVLDTQFWLATHVVCITIGYATTFVAGLMGLTYIIMGVATPKLTPKFGKELSRMIYGTICFAIFFSFVGTVLGGLWADDSWGRFWGWDPKENGALIIVLWNALVLHARWDGMIKDRGLAALAVFGNVVTSWSWFGVNELGVGLHSYGFTEGVLLALLLFVASQLVVIGVACLPKSLWWSFRQPGQS